MTLVVLANLTQQPRKVCEKYIQENCQKEKFLRKREESSSEEDEPKKFCAYCKKDNDPYCAHTRLQTVTFRKLSEKEVRMRKSVMPQYNRKQNECEARLETPNRQKNPVKIILMVKTVSIPQNDWSYWQYQVQIIQGRASGQWKYYYYCHCTDQNY